MSNIIAFPVPLATGPTVADEISQVLAALAERPPSADSALFAEMVDELQSNIDNAATDDDLFAHYLRMGILLGFRVAGGPPRVISTGRPS